MTQATRLLLAFGLPAFAISVIGSLTLGAMLPGYDPIAQTISELGESGSAHEGTFKLLTLVGAICLLLFSLGLGHHSRDRKLSILPSILIGSYGLMEVGIVTFPSPHPWHNIFGILGTPGLLAPLGLLLLWRGRAEIKYLRYWSAVFAAVIIAAIILNLSPLVQPHRLVLDYYGIYQRVLLYSYYAWIGFLSARLTYFDPPHSKFSS